MSNFNDAEIKKLEVTANEIRQSIIEALVEAKSGHSAGPLGMADVLTALFFHVLNIDPKKPNWPERDRLVLSNGHICPVLYTTMAYRGFFPKKELMTLRKLGTRLQGHPHRESLPGLENTSGPLGLGLGQAVGMAYGLRMDGKKNKVYCLMSDAEQAIGLTWEAALFAGDNKLDNLTAIIDRNNIQIDGMTEKVMPLEPIKEKYENFGWHVIEVSGHDMRQIIEACHQADAIFEKPVIIIAHTIPGKGVDFMEFDFNWHGKPPNKEEAAIALKELRTLGGKIQSEHE